MSQALHGPLRIAIRQKSQLSSKARSSLFGNFLCSFLRGTIYDLESHTARFVVNSTTVFCRRHGRCSVTRTKETRIVNQYPSSRFLNGAPKYDLRRKVLWRLRIGEVLQGY